MESVFLMALKGDDAPNQQWSLWDRFIHFAVRTFQPNPVFTHVELFVPPDLHATNVNGTNVHFSTYNGQRASWGERYEQDPTFYTGFNFDKWIAIPVRGDGAVSRLRAECEQEVQKETPYSLLGYLFSVPPLRALASIRRNGVGAPAHCAALTARVLSRAIKDLNLPCSDAWYGPSTLFSELGKSERMKKYQGEINDTTPNVTSLPEQHELECAYEALMSGSDEDVRRLTITQCMLAVNYQASKVIDSRAGPQQDHGTVPEHGLARLLIRWSTVRNQQSRN